MAAINGNPLAKALAVALATNSGTNCLSSVFNAKMAKYSIMVL